MRPGPDTEPIDTSPPSPAEAPIEPGQQKVFKIKTHDQLNSNGLAGDAVNEFSGVESILKGRGRFPMDADIISAITDPRKHYVDRLEDIEKKMTVPVNYHPDPEVAARQEATRGSYVGFKDRVMKAATHNPSASESIKEFDTAVDEYNKALKKYKENNDPGTQEKALSEMLVASDKALRLF